ncbi:unnamed protein product [Mytilus coruscus]|uniref:MEGF10_11 n=1 Tax=Mytilus coruscus TaxID=42192 RepID=A0A6J8EW77_MYTCO|nr:unnamed protein product [Mytilus coruscus]
MLVFACRLYDKNEYKFIANVDGIPKNTDLPNCGIELKWFVYCGGIAGFILLVGVCFACVQFRKRRQKPSTSITNDENKILRVSGKGNQNPPEQKKSMHIYHTIDDNILAGPNTNCYAYSEVIIESSSQKSKKSGTETACSYAQPYQSLVPETLEMHHYRCDHVNGCVSKFEIGESVAATTKTKDESLSVTARNNHFPYTLRRRQKPNTAITNDENRILRVSGKGNQNASEQKKSMHIYHTIDDNILVGPNANCYAYSEVMIESSIKKGQTSGTETACSNAQHAQQYQSLVPATMEMHHYDDKGNSLNGHNSTICEDGERNIEYCCSDYEDINGTCTECKIGFMSTMGKPCYHCPKNRFGERCLDRCNCSEIEERCDHVNGCVSKFEIGESVAATTKNKGISVTARNNHFYTLSGKFLIQKGNQNNTFFILERILRASGKENQNASEQKKSMHINHIIDDNILPGRNTNCYAYCEVMIESSSQKSKKCEAEAACGYAQHAQQYKT